MGTIYRSSKIFLRVSLSILLWLSITKSLDAQEWYNANWQYRSPVTVTNPGGTTLSDFQVKVTLSTGNFDFTRVLNDGSDIRLTASDGTTLIPFWIEPDNWNYPTSARHLGKGTKHPWFRCRNCLFILWQSIATSSKFNSC